MKAVIYRPADGEIVQRIETSPSGVAKTAIAMGMAFVEVADDQPYELTHRVEDGELVAK